MTWLDKEKLLEFIDGLKMKLTFEGAKWYDQALQDLVDEVNRKRLDAPEANQLREDNAKLVKALEHIAFEVSCYVGEEVEVARRALSELKGREHQ